MKTIQMSIDESLLQDVDRVIRARKTSLSDFVQEALQIAIRRHTVLELEEEYINGYRNNPVLPGEFDEWEPEQVWEELG